MVRSNWQNLNGLCNYAVTDSTTYRPNNFDGQILVPYPLESALSGVKRVLRPDEKLWYERTFIIKDLQMDKRYLIHFGAVDFQASVYVNGKEAGMHKGGYQEFTFDITRLIQKGSNELMVVVLDPTDKGDNPKGKQVLMPQGIMYTSTSGIWQTVWLEVVPRTFIEDLEMTPDVDRGILNFIVHTNIREGNCTFEAIARVGGKTVNMITGDVNKSSQLPVPGMHCWSPQDPFLYDLSVRLYSNGKLIDTVRSYFGMRKIEIKKDEAGIDRIFLNNKYIFNLGLLDQGFWPDGIYTAPTDEALRSDIEVSRRMGFNTIRKHIKIEPARWYYHCDELGMLVWQDMPYPANLSGEAKVEFERENEENLRQLHNYPSIVCWVLFNEGWNSYDQERLTEWMKKTDSSRLVDGHTGENYCRDCPRDPSEKWVRSDMADIHDYPGPDLPPVISGKAQVLGEWGGIRVATPGHQWEPKKGWGYIQSAAGDLARKYEFMIRHLKLFEEEGLSASIFTQPFDVEIEENGLITYDREVMKIPVETIRRINALITTNLPVHMAKTSGQP
jgi:beta-galactosidase/beta-glucuronidase